MACQLGMPPLCNIHYKVEIYGNLGEVSTVLYHLGHIPNAALMARLLYYKESLLRVAVKVLKAET